MTAPIPRLDAQLARLRESLADAAPPPSVDHAIATAVGKAQRSLRRKRPRRFEAWLAWPLGLAASIVVLSFVVRSVQPSMQRETEIAAEGLADAPASFMPVVPIAELERAGDTLVVPTRMSRLSLAQFGLPINPARAADAIDAELLVRPDGAVLAVRFIN
jgi:hypothetical protein